MNKNKDSEQKKHLDKWIKKGCNGTAIAPTGVGKTRILVLALDYILTHKSDADILIVVPTDRIRDYEIPNEIKRWLGKSYLKKVTIECIQTSYKRYNEHWDALLVDEIDTTFSEEYRKLYYNNFYDKILGLSATKPEDKEYHDILKEVAPIVSVTTVERALDLELISNYDIYNLPVPFTSQERKDYDKATFNYENMSNKLGGRFRAFKKASAIMNNKKDYSDDDAKTAAIFFGMIRKRKAICFNAENKIHAIKSIVEKFPDRYTIVFGEYQEYCDKIADALGDIALSFHSGLTAKEKRERLKTFNDKRTKVRVLVTAKALDRGFNVENISLAITAAGSSKKRQNIQRLGRSVRIQEGKRAIMINLYVPYTQEEKWVQKRLKDLNDYKWVTSLEEVN